MKVMKVMQVSNVMEVMEVMEVMNVGAFLRISASLLHSSSHRLL
jgi:hypothetical protein